MKSEKLEVELGNLRLRNPTLMAAGILGLTGSSLKRVWNSGAGGVVTKSVSKEPNEGYPGPNVVETPCGLLNAMGLPNPGTDEIKEEIDVAKKEDVTVVGSIYGGDEGEFSDLTERMKGIEVDAVELNLSCPHAGELSTIGRDATLTENMVKSCSGKNIPVWAKLPGNTNIPQTIEVAKAAEEAGAEAIVITNTVPAMAIDARARKPILGNKKGGLSGRAIKPVGLRLVYEIYEEIDIPIIGVGGIECGEDLIEYFLAGASAVEIGTGIMNRGMDIFEKVCEEAVQYLDGENIKELTGKAH